jgi:cell division cycle 2-like protein
MWSIGCIFGELILKEPLLPGKGEIDQVAKVRPRPCCQPWAVAEPCRPRWLGRPTEEVWPGFSKLPNAKSFNVNAAQPYVSPTPLSSIEPRPHADPPFWRRYSTLRQTFKYTSEAGVDLMSKLLCYDPAKRISAEEAMKHPFFSESPLPKHESLFASFPSVAG